MTIYDDWDFLEEIDDTLIILAQVFGRSIPRGSDTKSSWARTAVVEDVHKSLQGPRAIPPPNLLAPHQSAAPWLVPLFQELAQRPHALPPAWERLAAELARCPRVYGETSRRGWMRFCRDDQRRQAIHGDVIARLYFVVIRNAHTWLRLHDPRPGSTWWGWVKNQIAGMVQRHGPDHLPPGEETSETDYRPQGSGGTGFSLDGLADDSAGSVEIRNDIRAAMERLTPEERTAIKLRFFDNRPWADIAKQLGTSVPAAQQLVHRAMRKLREYLDDWGD